jgi:hypothetical protein
VQIIGYENARLIRLCIASSPGQLYLPKAIQLLVERYKFVGFPTKLEELSGNRNSFVHGVFNGVAIDQFDIYGDGFIVASKSPSAVLDEFVEDLNEWLRSSFNIHLVETLDHNKVSYETGLLVHTDAPILQVLDRLAPIKKTLQASLKKVSDIDTAFDAFSFGLATDHTLIPGMKPIAFRVERRASSPFEMNYYA